MELFSPTLWLFTLLALTSFLFGFLMFLLSHKHFLKQRKENLFTVSEVILHQVNFIFNHHFSLMLKKSLAWKILTLSGHFFNIIILGAFTTFMIPLLSFKAFDYPLESIEDFLVKKTHKIYYFGYFYFHDENQEILKKWNIIVNTEQCEGLIKKFNAGVLRKFCEKSNIALELEPNDFYE